MSFDLKVDFEFLCAFAPPAPFQEGPKESYVVLPDFTSVPKPFRAHHPCMLYNQHHRVPDSELENEGRIPRPFSNEFPPRQPTNRRLVMCEGEEIEIRPNGQRPAESDLKLNGSLVHLMRIQMANDKLGILKRSLVSDSIAKDVKARMHLREGTLGEAEVTPEEFGLFEVGARDPFYKQQMARRVTLTVEGMSFVDIAFSKPPEPQGKERILRLRTADLSSTVTIRNCEKDFIWSRDLPGYDPMGVGEINLYFPLSNNYDRSKPPRTIELRMITDFEAPNGVCAPKTFDGLG